MQCLLTIGLFAVLTAVVGRAFGVDDTLFELAEVGLLSVCLYVTRGVLPVVERHDRGAVGEEHVGAILDGLAGAGWRVIHDVQFGPSNVDHVVVGPGGVFTIETKSHPGPIRVHNLHGGLVRQVHTQRERVEHATGVAAEPLVVFSRAWVDHPGRRRRGVRVLPAAMLAGWLRARPAILSSERVAELYAQLAQLLATDSEHDISPRRAVARHHAGAALHSARR